MIIAMIGPNQSLMFFQNNIFVHKKYLPSILNNNLFTNVYAPIFIQIWHQFFYIPIKIFILLIPVRQQNIIIFAGQQHKYILLRIRTIADIQILACYCRFCPVFCCT